MNNHAMELLIVRPAKLVGIRKDGIEWDNKVAVEHLAFCIVECDNVCVVIMAEVLIVHLKDFLVVDEHIAYLANFLSIGFYNAVNPTGCIPFFDMGKLHPL